MLNIKYIENPKKTRTLTILPSLRFDTDPLLSMMNQRMVSVDTLLSCSHRQRSQEALSVKERSRNVQGGRQTS